MAPSRKSVNQTTVNPAALKRKGKAIEAAKPMDCRPTLSDIHISDTEDYHPNTALPLKMQTAESEPPLNGDQLLQMLSSMRKQMENQQTDVIRLREVATLGKEAATVSRHVCSNRSEHNEGRDLLPLREETRGPPFANAHTGIRSLHQKLKAHPIGDL